MRQWFYILVLGTSLVFPVSSMAGVINDESRSVLTLDAPEIGFAGMVINSAGSCSVALVGKRVAISNRHCFFIEEDGKKPVPRDFLILDPKNANHSWFKKTDGLDVSLALGIENFKPNKLFEFTEIYWSDTRDFAILIVDKNEVDKDSLESRQFPGEIYRTLELCDLDVNNIRVIHHAGFSENFTLHGPQKGNGHIEKNCLAYVSGSNSRHLCDNGRGASGGPIWVDFGIERCLVGVNSAENCRGILVNGVKQCASANSYTHNSFEVANANDKAFIQQLDQGSERESQLAAEKWVEANR